MHLPVQVEKAIQAIGVLFRQDGVANMNYMRVLKLLYIADRESLSETGRTIVGGPVVAMERGPVLEEVYDLMRGRHKEMPLWDKYFRRLNYNLVMCDHPDVKKLSKYQIGKLQDVAERHKDDDEWSLVHLTHKFPEWAKNNPGQSSKPISFHDILEAVGMAGHEEEIAADMRHIAEMKSLFEGTVS